MRRTFASALLKEAKKNQKIVLITMDLGFKMWDEFKSTLPGQYIGLPASEQAGIGVAAGIALSGGLPFVYSITPFLLYRPLEAIRNYLHQEKIGVNLVGSGRDKDYLDDGFTHWCEEAKPMLNILSNIKQFWPEDKEEIPYMVNKMINNDKPTFISLKR